MFNVGAKKRRERGAERRSNQEMLEPKKRRETGAERGSNQEMLEPKKIRKRKGREEAKESIGAKIKRKRGVRKAMMIFLCQVLTLHYLVLIHNSQFQS